MCNVTEILKCNVYRNHSYLGRTQRTWYRMADVTEEITKDKCQARDYGLCLDSGHWRFLEQAVSNLIKYVVMKVTLAA